MVGQCFQYLARLLAAAASEFNDHTMRVRCSAMSSESAVESVLPPRQTILGKPGDRFKQGGADVVVKIL